MTYYGAGNRTAVSCSMPGSPGYSGDTTYQYHKTDGSGNYQDELTQESSTRNSGFTNNFGYDAAYNPTSFKGTTYSFNSNNQVTNTGFSYDSNGNPTTYGGTSLTFDVENRLTAYGSAFTAGYDGDNLRSWKAGSSGSKTYFVYDGAEPVLELDNSGSISAVNTFGPTGLLSRKTSSANTFYVFDEHGNLAQRTDGSGTILTYSLFDAFGTKLSTDTQSDPWGYGAQAGYYTDTETGLILCTHRYYDPSAGRWLNRDPIGYGGGINLYGYVVNSPATQDDPSGFSGDDAPKGRPVSYEEGVDNGVPGVWKTYRNGDRIFEPNEGSHCRSGHDRGRNVKPRGGPEHSVREKGQQRPVRSTGGGRANCSELPFPEFPPGYRPAEGVDDCSAQTFLPFFMPTLPLPTLPGLSGVLSALGGCIRALGTGLQFALG